MKKYDLLKLENQLCFPLYVCSRQIVSLYSPYLKEFDLTYTQYIVFLALWEKDNITVSELCNTLYLDNGTLSPLVKKLEERGYVERLRSKDDERVVRIKLTEKGLNLKDDLYDIPLKVGNCVNIDPEDAGKLYEILYKIIK